MIIQPARFAANDICAAAPAISAELRSSAIPEVTQPAANRSKECYQFQMGAAANAWIEQHRLASSTLVMVKWETTQLQPPRIWLW